MASHPTPARAYAELNLLKMKLELLRNKLALHRLKCDKFIEFYENQQPTTSQKQ